VSAVPKPIPADFGASAAATVYVLDKAWTKKIFGNNSGPGGVASFSTTPALISAAKKAFPAAGLPTASGFMAATMLDTYVKGVIYAKYSKSSRSLSVVCPVKN
jgi:hypothetical protein